MAKPVGYGQVSGGKAVYDFPAGASVSIRPESGKWMCMTSSYAYLVGTSSNSNIIGYAEIGGTFSTAATAGNDLVPVNTDRSAVVEMPILPSVGSYTETNLKARLMMHCDINLSTNGIQYADTATSTLNQIQIVGYKYYGSALGEQTVLVRLAVTGLAGVPTYTEV